MRYGGKEFPREDAVMDEAEFLASVARLMELKELEAQIAQEQAEVRAELAAFLESRAVKGWSGQIMGRPVRVTRQERTQITYDEDLLRQRLGERYRLVIGLDRKRLAQREEEVLRWLGDHAPEVCTVDREKVRAALEKGECSSDEFRGAFERKVTYTVALQTEKADGK
jgi:hypothetical protein